MQVEWDTPLEISQRELQLCFRPRPNPRSEQRVIVPQSCGSIGTKNHSGVGAAGRHKEYYMGEGGSFPRVRAVVSLVSPKLPMVCPSTKGALENELTNLLIGLVQVRISN